MPAKTQVLLILWFVLQVSVIISHVFPNRSSILNDLLIINYYKDELSVAASSRSHVIGLSKTRWVEGYKAYENYYSLFKFI